jgi:hypothetical protein
LIVELDTGVLVSTIDRMFASNDEQEMRSMLREVDELRRARGLPTLRPWWQIQRRGLFGPRRFRREGAVAGDAAASELADGHGLR